MVKIITALFYPGHISLSNASFGREIISTGGKKRKKENKPKNSNRNKTMEYHSLAMSFNLLFLTPHHGI